MHARTHLEHKHVELAFLHHVKVIPALALPNDHFTRDDVPLDHNIEKEQALHHVEVAEQKIALHCVLQQFDLRLRLCRQLGRHVLSVILPSPRATQPAIAFSSKNIGKMGRKIHVNTLRSEYQLKASTQNTISSLSRAKR
jgi:hypothetical protein